MKFSDKLLKFLALLPAALLFIFLFYSRINSSDFPLGIVGAPLSNRFAGHHWDKWANFDSLNQNRVWNYRGVYDPYESQSTDLGMYLDSLNEYGMKAILGKGGWDCDWQNPDSIPFLVDYYSNGQYLRMEAEMDSDRAQALLDSNHTGYYFLNHATGGVQTNFPAFWYVSKDSSNADTVVAGPYETAKLAMGDSANVCWGEPCFVWPDKYDYDVDGRNFKHTINAMIDKTGQNPSTVAFKLFLYYDNWIASNPDNVFWHRLVDSLVIRVSDFSSSMTAQTFSFIAPLSLPTDSDYVGMIYKVYWPGQVNLWVDYLEYTDQNSAEPLINLATRAATLDAIYQQCDSIEQSDINQVIAGWIQSDEPRRPSFTAHGLINDYLIQHGIQMPQTIQNPLWSHDYKNFVHRAKPRVLIEDYYRLRDDYNLGDQTELQMFCDSIEVVHQAAEDVGIPFYAMIQAHYEAPIGSSIVGNRDPSASEIFAQAYIALAHGAKGIFVYKYTSDPPKSYGLVDTTYNHPNTEAIKYNDKWHAVKELYAQLDSIGDYLLDLDRVAAYCCTNPDFHSPVMGISFTDASTPYIEVGQFQDSQDADYFIVVNRKTDADKHINIETNKTGLWALRDLYTQERYLSSTGNFKGIPIKAGEGRVFKFEINKSN
jgi:hypothetical protein